MENVKHLKSKAAVCGAAAGAVNGLLGAGGGIVLVPLLTNWLKLETKHAFATALSVMLPLTAVSCLSYFLSGVTIPFSETLPYLLGGAAGGLIGGKLTKKISGKLLRVLFALLLIFGGIRSLVR